MAEMNVSEQPVDKAPPLTLANVLSVVKGVRNWRTLAKHLVQGYDKDDDEYRGYIDATDLDALQREHGSDEDCLKTVVRQFLQGEGMYSPASWRAGIWSLYKANEIQLANQIRSYGEQLEDDSLTVDNVTKVMEMVTADRIMKVWDRLYVPQSLVKMITGNLSTTKEKTRPCVDIYLNCSPYKASWKEIAEALYGCDEMAAAREAKPFYHKNNPTLTIENLVGVMKKLTSDKKRRREVWRKVLRWRGHTPDSYLDEVDTKYTTEKEKTNVLADVYINSRPDSSWKHIVETLYKKNEVAAAKEAKSFLQQNDPTLTVENVTQVMEMVTVDKRRQLWERVLREEAVQEIYSSHSSEEERLQYCSETYATTKVNSSWEELVQKLYIHGELAAAKKAKSFLQQKDPTLTVEKVVEVMEKVKVDKRRQVWRRVLTWRWESTVDQLYSRHSTEKEKNLSCSDTYVNCRPEASWEHLTTLLYEEDEMIAVDQTRPFLPPKDLTLTTDRLKGLFESVKDLDMAGSYFSDRCIVKELGLPVSVVEQIKSSYQSTTQRKDAYLDAYTHRHPCPSWRKVAHVLRRCQLYQQAKQVENTFVQVSEKTTQNYNAAMKDGSILIRNGTVFFLGAGGTGKSHTLAALLEEDPPSIRQSTSCVQKSIRTIAQCKVGVSGAQFIRIKDEDYSDMLGTTAKQFQVTEPSGNKTTLPPAPSKPQKTTSKQTTSASSPASSEDTRESTSKQEAPPSTPKKQKKKALCGFDRELQRRMQALPKASEALNDKDILDMKDSGGQTAFHEVLPLFVKNTTVGILIIKLNESFDVHPLVEYFSNGDLVGEAFKSHLTHLQTVGQCLRVVYSTCDKNTRPRILFIGTHKDVEHECKPKEDRKEKNRKLQKIIPPAMKDNIIYCDDSLEELIFAVNVKTPGDEDRAVIDQVREMMIKELKKIPQKELPLRYFALENAFVRLAKQHGKPVLSKEECFQEATAFHFTRDSFEDALRYLHSLNLIFYYEEILPGIVFIDAQTLLDKITELVEYSLRLRSKKSRKGPVSDATTLEEFKAYGFVTLEFLSEFKTHYVPNLFTANEFILLLKFLRVLAEVGNRKFLVPCLLKVTEIGLLSPHLAIRTIPVLLYYFGQDGAKLGVYCCLISSLITEAKWELMTENNRPVQVSRNQVQFKLPGGDPGAITITDSFRSYFHVSIDFPKSMESDEMQRICEKYCPIIRETILTGIRKASQKLNYNNSIPTIAFPCSNHPDTDLHPATVSSCDLLTCTTHPSTFCCKITEHHKFWLDDSSNKSAERNLSLDQVLDVEHDGVPVNLGRIADRMDEWEGSVADNLGLTPADVTAIKVENPQQFVLQVRAALGKWKQRLGSDATYRNLISAFEHAGRKDFADTVQTFATGTFPVTTVQLRQSSCGGKQTQTTEEQQTEHEVKLDQVLDFEHGGIPVHLSQIADCMDEWEGSVADQLGLTPADVSAIKTENSKQLILQVQAALGKWKQHLGSDATYRNLISAFERAGRQDFADTVYAIAGTTGTQPSSKDTTKQPTLPPQESRPVAMATTKGPKAQLLAKSFKMLIPIAKEWQNIGTLLELSQEELDSISSRCVGDVNQLREMLRLWLSLIDNPSSLWKTLAEAVEPFNSQIAAKIVKE